VTARVCRRAALSVFVPAAILVMEASLPRVARADVVHLKNGGTIACDSIEERGADLVLRQRGGVIVVPRSEVARIERTATAAGAAPAAAPAGGPPPGAVRPVSGEASGAAASGAPAAPLVSEGERALSERRYEDARRLFEEALLGDPAALRARRGLGAALLGLGQPARARSVLEQALLEAPNDADLYRLLGEALVRLDRATEAIAALEKSHALRPDSALRKRIDDLRRQHGVDADYRRAEAARFTVVYDRVATSPAVEAEILPFLDGQFPTLSRLFDYVPTGTITVVVYPEEGFRHATQADSTVAGLYDGKVRVPSGGLRRLDTGARAVLTHELAHAFIAGKSAGGAPRWLHEGLAQWAEGKRTPAATETTLAREYRDSAGGGRWGAVFTYASALSFVEYLQTQHGQSDLNQVLAEIGRGADAEGALRTVTRDSLAELLAAWGDDLVRRRLP
jgi:hypothetical protein